MGAPQTIKQNFSNDFTALLWNVQCCDAAGNCAMNQTNAVGTGGNRTVRLDATFPSSFSEYYNVSSSGRFPETYEWVNFSAKWIDLNLSNCGFMLNNATPFYANYTPKPCQSGWNISFIEQMNATDNQNISWIFWANDSAGNLNFTSVFSLVVRNESPKFKSDNINISVYPRTYQWLNFSVNWTDNSWFGRNSDKLQTCGFMLNNGTPTFVNYSWKLCSSGWNISFIEIMNATDNQNVSWVFWANDTTNNINFTPAFSIVMRNESPVFYSNITNSTTQKQNDWVNFSINWTDNSWFGRNSDKLQNCWFGVKDGTPTMVNTTPIPCSSGWNISFVEQISDVAGQTVFYQFYANDTTNNVNATYLSSFVIAAANTLPTTPLTFSPANGSSIVNRTPAFSWVNSTDADGNVISYHLQVDDNLRFNNPEINVTAIVPTAGNENTTYYPSAVLNVDTTYYWRVRANDSIGFGGWSNNAANDGPGGGPGEGQNRSNFTVNSYLAITLYNNPIEFGVLNPGAVENTTDGSPLPILGVNDGNIFFNLSINASSYFETAAMNTSNYQYKFRANESGSFDTALSTITWTNMSKDPLSRVDVAECNWRDVNDDFLMDLNITLPIDEPAGLKMSNITYTVTSSSIS